MSEEFKISEDVAIGEVKAFVEYHLDKTIDIDRASDDFVDIKKSYENILKAVKRGLLSLENYDAPVLTLKNPLKSDGGNFNVEKITFKTRITKSTMDNLSKGFDVSNRPMGFANILTTYYTGLESISILNKVSESKADIKTIDEMVGLFQ